MKILGLDAGSHSIKGVEIDASFGRFEIRDYHDLEIQPGSDPTLVLQALLQGLSHTPDRIAVSLSSAASTFRNLNLPSTGKKAIQAAIAFELEDELPFPTEETVYDYSLSSQTKTTSTLHVGATLKKHVAAFLAKFSQAGIDPDLVTTEVWAYRVLLNRVLPKEVLEGPRPVLLIQIGHTRTTLYCHFRGQAVLCRELAWGSRNLTDSISKKYDIPVDQAEKAKKDGGFVIPDIAREGATPEQLVFSDTLAEPIQYLITDLKQVMLSIKSVTHQNLSNIYLSGAGSLLPGLAAVLQESLAHPVEALKPVTGVGSSEITYSDATEAAFSLALASALCLVGPEKNLSINLRKGEFSKMGRTKELDLANLKNVSLASLAVFGAMVLSYSVQIASYQKNLSDVDKRLETSIRTFFGQISNLKTYTSSPTTLKTSVNKELAKQRDLFRLLGPNTQSPFEYLNDLSKTIPKDVIVDVTQISVGASATGPYSASAEQSANISVLVSNPQIAEKLATLLTSKISGLQKGKMEEVTSPDGTTKKWKLTFTGKPLYKSAAGDSPKASQKDVK